MIRISKILFSEIKFLLRTIALIGIIIVFFIAALLSVISVLLDIPEGFYSGMNEAYRYKYLTASDIDLATAEANGGTPLFGSVNGITRYSTIKCDKSINSTPSPTVNDNDETNKIEQQPTFSVTAFMVMGEGLTLLNEYESCVTTGRMPSENGEMVITSAIAALIGAKIGDEVTFSPDLSYENPEIELDMSNVKPMNFTIVGFIASDKIFSITNKAPQSYPLPAANIYLVSDIRNFDRLAISFPDSKTAHNKYKEFLSKGIDCTPVNQNIYDVIDTAVAFFAAVSAVLGLMVIFIIYSLVSIFFRQRKGMICRLKLLGATDRQIGYIYCAITIFLIFIGVVIGSAFAMAFNVYFINLCGSLFTMISVNFVSHFHPSVQASVFFALAIFTVLIFLKFDRKIKKASIAAEVKHE